MRLRLIKTKFAYVVFFLALLPSWSFAGSVYDSLNGTVTIDNIRVNETRYIDVVLTPASIISIGTSGPFEQRVNTNLSASYNTVTGHLKLVNLSFEGTNYPEVIITIADVISFDSIEFVGIFSDFSDRVAIEPTYFAANDVPESRIISILDWVKRVSDDWFKKDSKYWKYFNPIDIWIVGADYDAAVPLNSESCKRFRDAYPKRYLSDGCNVDKNPNGGLTLTPFENFITGGGSINTSRHRDGVHNLNLGGLYPLNGKGIAHEMFHIYQISHFETTINNKWTQQLGLSLDKFGTNDHETIQNILGGKETEGISDWQLKYGKGVFEQDGSWWMEGGAEYMGYLWYSKQSESIVLAKSDEERDDYFKYQLERVFDAAVIEFQKTGLKVHELTYGHGSLGYDIGFLFVAYLVREVGLDFFLNGFFNEIGELGFDETFLKNFGKTYQQFALEFDALLKKPKAEVISAMLPTSG